jgi:heat shock protein HtpX
MLVGTMVVAAFSRWREYRADAGGASLTGTHNMIAALEALKRTFEMQDPQAAPALATLKISGRPSGFLALFSTHPPLEERIERLRSTSFAA